MRPTKIDKVAKPLPDRAALKRLDASRHSLLDYSKANEAPSEPMPAVLSLIARKRR